MLPPISTVHPAKTFEISPEFVGSDGRARHSNRAPIMEDTFAGLPFVRSIYIDFDAALPRGGILSVMQQN